MAAQGQQNTVSYGDTEVPIIAVDPDYSRGGFIEAHEIGHALRSTAKPDYNEHPTGPLEFRKEYLTDWSPDDEELTLDYLADSIYEGDFKGDKNPTMPISKFVKEALSPGIGTGAWRMQSARLQFLPLQPASAIIAGRPTQLISPFKNAYIARKNHEYEQKIETIENHVDGHLQLLMHLFPQEVSHISKRIEAGGSKEVDEWLNGGTARKTILQEKYDVTAEG